MNFCDWWIAQHKAFSPRGFANGMASLRDAARTLRASPRTFTGKQATLLASVFDTLRERRERLNQRV
jgi:hypothetical protein